MILMSVLKATYFGVESLRSQVGEFAETLGTWWNAQNDFLVTGNNGLMAPRLPSENSRSAKTRLPERPVWQRSSANCRRQPVIARSAPSFLTLKQLMLDTWAAQRGMTARWETTFGDIFQTGALVQNRKFVLIGETND